MEKEEFSEQFSKFIGEPIHEEWCRPVFLFWGFFFDKKSYLNY